MNEYFVVLAIVTDDSARYLSAVVGQVNLLPRLEIPNRAWYFEDKEDDDICCEEDTTGMYLIAMRSSTFASYSGNC